MVSMIRGSKYSTVVIKSTERYWNLSTVRGIKKLSSTGTGTDTNTDTDMGAIDNT